MDKEFVFVQQESEVTQESSAVELSELQLMLIGGGCGETIVG